MKAHKKNWLPFLCLALLLLPVLAGCQSETVPSPSQPAPTQIPPPVESREPSPTPGESEPPQPEVSETPRPKESETPRPEGPLVVSDRDALKAELTDAIVHLRQPPLMDISQAGLTTPDLDVKNLYYEIVARDPDLKYAYDVTAAVNGSELTCIILYMPYKTGEFPVGFSGVEVSSLKELLLTAEENMGEQPTPIRITDPTLDPDTMNCALQQVGGGYVICFLSPDGTEIRYNPPMNMTLEDCRTALEQADLLADQVIAQVITEDMTQREKAQALYSYLTQTVAYDHRYYSDRANMPYESQTALGALRDGLAICGGYSLAVQLLFEKVGIPCYNVTGSYFRENHMWSYVLLDGQWYYCDATSDRGGRNSHFLLTQEEWTALGEHKWDPETTVHIIHALEGSGNPALPG